MVFRAPAKTEVFSDRLARLAATTPARAFAEDFAADFAGDSPNVALSGWRKRRQGGWRRAYAVVTATAVTFDAATRELRYAVVQFPGQAGVTKGLGGEGGARTEALRFCAGFVDSLEHCDRCNADKERMSLPCLILSAIGLEPSYGDCPFGPGC